MGAAGAGLSLGKKMTGKLTDVARDSLSATESFARESLSAALESAALETVEYEDGDVQEQLGTLESRLQASLAEQERLLERGLTRHLALHKRACSLGRRATQACSHALPDVVSRHTNI